MPFPELGGLRAKLFVGERLNLWFFGVDFRDERLDAASTRRSFAVPITFARSVSTNIRSAAAAQGIRTIISRIKARICAARQAPLSGPL